MRIFANLLTTSLFCLMISFAQGQVITSKVIAYRAVQANRTFELTPSGTENLLQSLEWGKEDWRFIDFQKWCVGFWPGVLWKLYEGTKAQNLKNEEGRFCLKLTDLSVIKASDQDLSFQIFNSFGHGYRLSRSPEYKKIMLALAGILATLFSPKVETILCPRSVPNMKWIQRITIIDNVINQEMLFWASKNGGSGKLYDIALSHGKLTMKGHITSYYRFCHTVVYNKGTGAKIKAVR